MAGQSRYRRIQKNMFFGKRLHRGAVEKSKAKKRKPPQLVPTELVVRGNLFTKNEMSKNSEREIYDHRSYAFLILTQR
jgi:hypothetical protein